MKRSPGRKKVSPTKKKVRKTITIDPGLLSILETMASQSGRSLSSTIDILLRRSSFLKVQQHLFEKEE